MTIVDRDVRGREDLEAGAAGLERELGRLVPAADPDSMARAMLETFRDPTGARQRGLRARADVERRFSLASMVQGYGELYERLLAQAAARGALEHRLT